MDVKIGYFVSSISSTCSVEVNRRIFIQVATWAKFRFKHRMAASSETALKTAENEIKISSLFAYLRKRGVSDVKQKSKAALVRRCLDTVDTVHQPDINDDLCDILNADVLLDLPGIDDYEFATTTNGNLCWRLSTHQMESLGPIPENFCGLPIEVIDDSQFMMQLGQGDGPISSTMYAYEQACMGLVSPNGRHVNVTEHYAHVVGNQMTSPGGSILGPIITTFRGDRARGAFNNAQIPSLPLSEQVQVYSVGSQLVRPATFQTGMIRATITRNRRLMVMAQAQATEPHSLAGDSNMVWESPNRGHAVGIHSSYDATNRISGVVKVRPRRGPAKKPAKNPPAPKSPQPKRAQPKRKFGDAGASFASKEKRTRSGLAY